MSRRETDSVRIPRKQHKEMKDLSEYTRVDMTRYMEEALDMFLEARAPLYRKRRDDEIRKISLRKIR